MLKTYPVTRSDVEWRALLTPEQFHMMREQGAERPGSSALASEKRAGIFSCAGCNSPLFESQAKFESGTGWPSFREPIPNAVETRADDAYLGGYHTGYGTVRTEVSCAICGSHLGHLFSDGPPPSGFRYCTNGIGLTFAPALAQ
ncbi:MAG: peptide-methionine (R)-S-oxide reductase MsrB [Devosia sp.]